MFINCPFDTLFRPIFEAIIFTVHDCGLVARCALEVDDASQVRIDKIFQIINECRYGVHDISRTELDPDSQLPRFNMPLELGMFLGAKRYGSKKNQQKLGIILDREQYRYQKFCSDIAGQDIRSHHGDPAQAIAVVRDWLRAARRDGPLVPSGPRMAKRYSEFRTDLPVMCQPLDLNADELIFVDFFNLLTGWLKENPW